MVKALVITGCGINCEKEMAAACERAGAQVSYLHVQEFFAPHFSWKDFQLLLFPGGFSFGDELGAAKILANRLLTHLRDQLADFVDRGNCILGVCNGFQLLVKLGLLPGGFSQTVSLVSNDSGRYECRWVNHRVCPSPCVFTQGLDSLYLPVRHAEGKLVAATSTLQELQEKQQVVLQYVDENPNGSYDAIAGLCDPTGRILGMMAHPEAALSFMLHPQWTRIKEKLKREKKPLPEEGEGLSLFKNVINYLGRS